MARGRHYTKLSLSSALLLSFSGMFVCCVVIPFILDVRLTCGRTSRGHTGGRSHRISPPYFCGACLIFSREKDSAVPFPRRP